MPEGRTFIAVVGAGADSCEAQVARIAELVGREIAKAGAVLVCGGLGGVMEAAGRGAQRADHRTSDAVIAIGGEFGTLSEIRLASKGLTLRQKGRLRETRVQAGAAPAPTAFNERMAKVFESMKRIQTEHDAKQRERNRRSQEHSE